MEVGFQLRRRRFPAFAVLERSQRAPLIPAQTARDTHAIPLAEAGEGKSLSRAHGCFSALAWLRCTVGFAKTLRVLNLWRTAIRLSIWNPLRAEPGVVIPT